jgi:outer membrane protein assembly factor BamB
VRLSRAVALALVLSTLALGACSSKGKLRQPTKLVELAKPELRPVEIWSRSAGNGGGKFFTGLRLSKEADGIFVAAVDGSVYALNPANGGTIWRTATKARVISGPTVADDKIYVGTLDGETIALQRATGKELWRTRVNSEVLAAPVASGDVVVVRSVDGREFGLSSKDGERLWNFDRTEPNLTLRGLSEPLILGGRVYSGMDNGKLVALNLNDGQVAWEQNISVAAGRSELARLTDIDADLLSAPAGLFVVTYANDIALVDPLSGESRWRRSIKSYSGMATDDKNVYVTDDEGLLWALDAETGAAVWKQEALKYRHLSAPAVFGGYIVVGDFQGYLHWFEPKDGRLVARTRAGSAPIRSAPVVDGKRLYVTSQSGLVAAYEAQAAK